MGFLGHGTGKKLEKLGWKAAQMYLGMGMPGMPGGGDAAAAAGGGNGNILSSLGGGTGGQAGGSQVGGSQTGSILGGLTGGGGGGGGVTSTIHPQGTGIGITGTPLANAYGYEDPSAISSMLGSGGQGPASQVGAGQQSLPGNLIGPGDRGWVGGQGGGSQKSTLGEIGSSLLDMGKDYVGGPDRVTGSDPTWQERLEGGFSAISPGFREHLKTKSDIESQGISTELNKAKLQEIREGNIEIGEDTLFPGLKGSAREQGLKHVQSLGYGTTDPQTGKTTYKKKNLQKLYKEFKENPDLQKRLFTEQGKVFEQDLNNLNSAEITAKRELAKKTLMTNGTDIKALAKHGVNVEDLIQNEINNIDRGGTQFPEKQAFAEQKKLIEKNIAGNNARLEEIKNKLVSPYQQSQIELNKAKVIEALSGGGFESTPTIESIARAEHGKAYRLLTQEQQNSVIERKFREEPQKIKMTMDLRKEFGSLGVIKDFGQVRGKFELMDSILTRYKAGDAEGNIALDQALITSFNKITDPQSVVRESEYARTPENLSFIEMLRGKYQKILEGGAGLTDEARQELVETSKVMRNSYFDLATEKANLYSTIAEKTGIDPSLVVTIPKELDKGSMGKAAEAEAEANSILGF